jgi:hypothetical protein
VEARQWRIVGAWAEISESNTFVSESSSEYYYYYILFGNYSLSVIINYTKINIKE